MQLRREHDPPFHEFIMIETQSDFIYRVDRGRAGGPVLGVIREGVPAQDTIALLRVTSLEQLDRTSYSMIELRWGNDKTIDLQLVLDICFHIHNTSGNRYKLLTYNCYFFAQTIIMITVRKTIAIGAKLADALNMTCVNWQLIEREAQRALWDQAMDLDVVLDPDLDQDQDTGWWREMQLGRLLGHLLGRELGRQSETALETQWGTRLGWRLGWRLGEQLGLLLEAHMGPPLEKMLVRPMWLRQEWLRLRKQVRRERLRQEQEQEQRRERDQRRRQQERQLSQELVQQEGQLIVKQKRDWWRQGWKKRKWEEAERQGQGQEEEQTKQEQEGLEREEQQKLERGHEQLSKQMQEQIWKLQPEWELALIRTRTLAKGALLRVLELAVSGELDPRWHNEWSELDQSADRFENELTRMWYVT